MRKKVVLLILGLLLLLFCGGYATVYASDKETTADVSELIDNLDLSALDEYLASLGEIYGGEVGLSAGEYLKAVINGDKNFDIDMLVSLVFSSLSQTRNLVSIASLLISICIIWSLVSGIEFKNNTNSAKKAVNIACFSIMSVIVLRIFSKCAICGRFCAANRAFYRLVGFRRSGRIYVHADPIQFARGVSGRLRLNNRFAA